MLGFMAVRDHGPGSLAGRWMVYAMVVVSTVVIVGALLSVRALGYSDALPVVPMLLVPVAMGAFYGGVGGGACAVLLGVVVEWWLLPTLWPAIPIFLASALPLIWLGREAGLILVGQQLTRETQAMLTEQRHQDYERYRAELAECERQCQLATDRAASVECALTDTQAECARLAGLLGEMTGRERDAEARAARWERHCQAIDAALSYGVWNADPEGQLTWISASFLKLTGLHWYDCANLGWLDRVHPEDRERVAASWAEAVRQQCAWESEYRLQGADGVWHPLMARGVPIRGDDGVSGWNGIYLDHSRLCRAEEALREADRKKEAFLAVLAHELRNPLAPILTSAQLLRRRGLERPELLESATASIERQVKYLTRMIGDLGDLSRLARGKLELSPKIIELDAALTEAVANWRPLALKQQQELTLVLPDEPVYIRADPERLAQVLGHLLENAARFTPARGKIQAGLRLENREAVLSVRDDGIGIEASEFQHIFEPFVQLERPLHGGGNGLGIGLALVKELVERQGGAVTVHSAGKGLGSEFVVRWPLLEL